jgi:hypothetical protein
MGYLLILNGQRASKFIKSAKLFIDLIRSENKERYNYINNFKMENLELYKLKSSELIES